MTQKATHSMEHAHDVVLDLIEDIFGAITPIHDAAVEGYRAAHQRGEPLSGRDITALREPICDLLRRPDAAVVGLGFIAAPGSLADEPLRLEWWQRAGASATLAQLEVDLNPDSLGFYDYEAAEWFTVPRKTRRRHVVGPYVDVHGTGRYIITAVMPVVCDEAFLGVAGADVPVNQFEARLLRQIGVRDLELVIVNSQQRVVLSTTSKWLTGSLVPADEAGSDTPSLPVRDSPWRLYLPDPTTP